MMHEGGDAAVGRRKDGRGRDVDEANSFFFLYRLAVQLGVGTCIKNKVCVTTKYEFSSPRAMGNKLVEAQ
jgi:hypothetical protein